MRRLNLPLAAFALSAACAYASLVPLERTRAGVVLFLGAILLAFLGVGLLMPRWALFLVATVLDILIAYPVYSLFGPSFQAWLVVFIGLPCVLYLLAAGGTALLKRWQERRFQRRYFGTR